MDLCRAFYACAGVAAAERHQRADTWICVGHFMRVLVLLQLRGLEGRHMELCRAF